MSRRNVSILLLLLLLSRQKKFVLVLTKEAEQEPIQMARFVVPFLSA